MESDVIWPFVTQRHDISSHSSLSHRFVFHPFRNPRWTQHLALDPPWSSPETLSTTWDRVKAFEEMMKWCVWAIHLGPFGTYECKISSKKIMDPDIHRVSQSHVVYLWRFMISLLPDVWMILLLTFFIYLYITVFRVFNVVLFWSSVW